MIFANVSAILRSFTKVLSKVLPGGTPPATSAPPLAPGIFTAAGLSAFVNFVSPIVHIVEGKGTLTDDEDAANAVMDVIATLDPTSAPVIDMIEAAEPVFAALVGLARANGFRISGGYPDIVGMENDRNFKNR